MPADQRRGSNLDYLLSLNQNSLVPQQRSHSRINQPCCLNQKQFFCCGNSRCEMDGGDEQESQQSIANHGPSGTRVVLSMSPALVLQGPLLEGARCSASRLRAACNRRRRSEKDRR